MIRVIPLLAISGAFALPALAQDTISGIPAGVIVYDAVPAGTGVTQSPASTRSTAPMGLLSTPVQSGTALDPSIAAGQVDLAPGETVLQVIASPSAIIKIPENQPTYTMSYSAPAVPEVRTRPEPKVDPVKGRLRDTAGWTGRTEGPASIGCFPQGACAVLNQR